MSPKIASLKCQNNNYTYVKKSLELVSNLKKIGSFDTYCRYTSLHQTKLNKLKTF